MEVIAFHLKGKMAHFRRYYSNSSALSYTIPPRTTITGLIAGLLGYKRDSYYNLFSLEKCCIAVGLYSPVKKIIQKMNLLKVERLNELNGSNKHHSQCATEWVIPHNIINNYLDYKVWFYHKDKKIMEKVTDLLDNQFGYYKSKGISFALGSAQNLGWIEFEDTYKASVKKSDFEVEIDSVIPATEIEALDVKHSRLFLIKEEVPLEFDKNRKLKFNGKKEMVINNYASSVKVRVNEYFELSNGEKIIWMQ